MRRTAKGRADREVAKSIALQLPDVEWDDAGHVVALGLTRFWQAQDGLRVDTAPYVAALECATGRQAIVMGKPAVAFFHAAAGRLGVPPEEVLMLCDDVRIDVGGAQRAGMRGGLVKTGKYRNGDLDGEVKPDLLLDSIEALPDWWVRR